MKSMFVFLLKLISEIISYHFIFQLKFGIPFKIIAIKCSTITGVLGNYIRQSFYRKTLINVGDNFKINYGSYFVYEDCIVGNNVTIEEGCVVSLCEIEDNVIFSPYVVSLSGKNHHSTAKGVVFTESDLPIKKIKIGKNVWIGTGAIIMDSIQPNTIIGAGSVYVDEIKKENCVIAGNPAKVKKERS